MGSIASFGWFGPIPLIGSAKQIAVAANIDFHLELFIISNDGRLAHSFQTQVNGIFWSPASSLTTFKVSQMAVIRNMDGRLEVFYTDTKGNLFHNFQQQPANIADPPTLKLPWAGEQPFVGIQAKRIAVAQNLDGRLEIFYIDQKNNLMHMYQTVVPSTPFPNTLNSWSAPIPFARTAKTIATGSNQDGRLEIFYTGTDDTLYHDWQSTPATLIPPAPNNPNPWTGRTTFGKNNKAKQVAIGHNQDGRLEILYVGTNNDLYHAFQNEIITTPPGESPSSWSAQSRISKISAKQVTVVTDPTGILYALYVGLKNKADIAQQKGKPDVSQPQTLNSWTAGSSLPQNAKQIVAANNADGRPEFFCVDTNNKLSHFWKTADLGRTSSNQNVIIAGVPNVNSSPCINLVNVLVAITITRDLIVQWTTGSTKGFSLQLNAFSAAGFRCVWQQYGFELAGSQMKAFANNWPGTGSGWLINSRYNMMKFKNSTIPAGTQFQISLGHDQDFNISEFSCTIFDGAANQLATITKKLKSVKGGQTKNLAPIASFELDIVGPINKAATVFSSGAGTIQYSSAGPLFAIDSIPACSGGQGRYTEEISNARYAAIPANQNFAFQQIFSVSGTANP